MTIIMNPCYTPWLLLGSLLINNNMPENGKYTSENSDSEADEKEMTFTVETMPCPTPNCKGRIYNSTLISKLRNTWVNDSLAGFMNYPPHISAMLISKVNEYSLIYPNMCTKDILYTLYQNIDIVPDVEFDNEDEWYNGYMCEFNIHSDMMVCHTCNNYYVICLNCMNPCVVESFCGSFTHNTGELEIARRLVDLPNNHHKLEEIGFKPDYCNEYNVKITSTDPNIKISYYNSDYKLIDITKMDNNAGSNTESSLAESDTDVDWLDEYYFADKRIIWTGDPRINLNLNGKIYSPILTGSDGGRGINFCCEKCNSSYYFNDK